MTDPEGTPMKLQILRDITEKKKLEKAKDDFISLASHQLRTPLSAISLSSELLLRGISGEIPPEQKEYIEEISKGAKRMTLLVSNFLNVSRIEMGTFSIETEPLDIPLSVETKSKYFWPIILEKKIEFKKQIKTDLHLTLFNANSFDIVFDNLLSNAIRYTPAGGRISLALGKKDDRIVLEISDTGCGIPDDLKEKVFEKSFRSDNAQRISSEGAGLGLYMVKSIADLTGSEVWYESAEGKGTSFFFSIPIK
jgi:signal transduction histidine kinase